MTPSALTLERAFFTRVALNASTDAGAKPAPTFETSVSAGTDPANLRRYQITIVVRLLAESGVPCAYAGEVEVQGFFAVAEVVPTENRERFALVHGSTLLFGMLREMICTVTARGPWPMFVLPTASFSDLPQLVSPHETKPTP